MMLPLRWTRSGLFVALCGMVAAVCTSSAFAANGRPRVDDAEESPVEQVSYTERVEREAVPMRPPLAALQKRSRSKSAGYRPGSRSMVSSAAHHQPVEEVMGSPAGEYAQGEVVYEGDMQGEYMDDGSYGDGYYEDGYGGDYFGGDCFGDGCFGGCLPPMPCFNNLQVFGGVNGFTGPANRGGTGSFGFFEGANFSNHFPFSRWGLSYQVGAMATQTNFSGTNFTLDDRTQTFVTGGIFRRVDCGLQGGVVVDYLHDNFYYQTDLVQLRYEFSWVYDTVQEVGFWGTSGTNDQLTTATFRTTAQGIVNTTTENFEALDIYSAFYRRRFCNGGSARFWGGFTNQSDGIIGGDAQVPLMPCVDLVSSFTYLIPEQGINDSGVVEESWNVFIGLVWYPGCMRRNECPYDKPLFNVANNGNFLVDRTTR